MLSSLRFALPAACLSLVACSGSDFALPTSADTGAVEATDTGAVEATDTGGNEGTDTEPQPADGGAVDSAPACNTDGPPAACVMPLGTYAPQFQTPSGDAVLGRIDTATSQAISYVTARAARHEKLIVRLRKTSRSGPTTGAVTVAAFRTPCPDVHIPYGKTRVIPAAEINHGDVSFYFNESANYLPAVPAGTRLTFVITTNSTAHGFELLGSPATSEPPTSFEWHSKSGAGKWEPGTAGMPVAQAWLRGCVD